MQSVSETKPSPQSSRRDAVRSVLGRLALQFGHPAMPEDQRKLWAEDYLDILERYPVDLVENARRVFIATPGARFFPKIGELTAIIEPKWRERLAAEARRQDMEKRMLPAIEGPGHGWTAEKVGKFRAEAARGGPGAPALLRLAKDGEKMMETP